MDALARGWNERDRRPAPGRLDAGLAVLGRRCCSSAPPPQDKARPGARPTTPSIAQTPLVIAMPKPMAEALGWPDKPTGLGRRARRSPATRKGWGASGHAEWGAFRLGKTNPHFSTSGLNATDRGLLRGHRPVQRPHRRGRGRPQGRRVRQGRRVARRALRRHDADVPVQPAPAPTRRARADVHQRGGGGGEVGLGLQPGQPDRATRRRSASARKPQVPLVAVYPKEGTLLSDNPYVVLTAAWVDEQEGGRRRLPRLRQGAGPAEAVHRARPSAAYERQGRRGADQHRQRPAAGRRSSRVIDPPASRRAATKVARRPGTSCASGPGCCWCWTPRARWATRCPAAAESKLDLAKQAATARHRQLAPGRRGGAVDVLHRRDSGQDQPYREQVPIGRRQARTRPAQGGDRRAGRPTAGPRCTPPPAPRYGSVRGRPSRDRINAVVVLTDGKNEYPPDNDLRRADRRRWTPSDAERAVRVFTDRLRRRRPTWASLKQIADGVAGRRVRRQRPGQHRQGARRRC